MIASNKQLLQPDMSKLCAFLKEILARNDVFATSVHYNSNFHDVATIRAEISLVYSSAAFSEITYKLNAFREKLIVAEQSFNSTDLTSTRSMASIYLEMPYSEDIRAIFDAAMQKRPDIIVNASEPIAKEESKDKLDEKTTERVLMLADVIGDVKRKAEAAAESIQDLFKKEHLSREDLIRLNKMYKMFNELKQHMEKE